MKRVRIVYADDYIGVWVDGELLIEGDDSLLIEDVLRALGMDVTVEDRETP